MPLRFRVWQPEVIAGHFARLRSSSTDLLHQRILQEDGILQLLLDLVSYVRLGRLSLVQEQFPSTRWSLLDLAIVAGYLHASSHIIRLEIDNEDERGGDERKRSVSVEFAKLIRPSGRGTTPQNRQIRLITKKETNSKDTRTAPDGTSSNTLRKTLTQRLHNVQTPPMYKAELLRLRAPH